MASGRLKSITTSLSFLCTYRVFSFRSDFLPPREIDACFISSCFFSLLLIWRLFRFITVDLTALERKRLLQHGGQAPGDRVIGVCNTYFRSPINFFLEKTTG